MSLAQSIMKKLNNNFKTKTELKPIIADNYTMYCNNCTDSKGQNIGNMYCCKICGRLVS